MSLQLTSHILMIRPVNFGFNKETAVNNHYQRTEAGLNADQVQQKALEEFDGLVHKLELADVKVTVISDSQSPHTPDSIFPNNWVSFHASGSTVLYPMFAVNRRKERRTDILNKLNRPQSQVLDLSDNESNSRFLEGTGSMVLDRKNKIAYACISERTDASILKIWSEELGYSTVEFHASQLVNKLESPIYHTNVMMSVGEEIAIVCLEVIRNPQERDRLVQTLELSGHRIIEITERQVNHFAGNMLQVTNVNGTPLMVMSTQAYESLNKEQIAQIEAYSAIIHSPINTIERLGGGSARCMMAEVF